MPVCDGNGIYTIYLLSSRKKLDTAHVWFDKNFFLGLEYTQQNSNGKDFELGKNGNQFRDRSESEIANSSSDFNIFTSYFQLRETSTCKKCDSESENWA